MKRIFTVLLAVCVLLAAMPRTTLVAAAPENLLTNGDFESYDSYDFPTGWTSSGQNILTDGDFESGSLEVGVTPTGQTLKWASPATSSNSTALVRATDTDSAASGNYYVKNAWKKSSWGGVGYGNLDPGNNLFNVAYGGQYILRAALRTNNTTVFNNAYVQGFYIAYLDSATKWEKKFENTDYKVSADWSEFSTTMTFDAKPAESGKTYYDQPRLSRFQLRYGGNTNMTANQTPVPELDVDNIRLEKLGRTTADTAQDGSRSLKYVGYADGMEESWTSSPVALAQDGEYTLTYYTSGDEGTAELVYDNGSKQAFTFTTAEESGWIKHTAVFTAAAGGNASVVLSAAEGAVTYFDSVSLTEVLAPASVTITAVDGLDYINLDASATKQLQAQVLDRNGNLITGEAVIWSIKEGGSQFSVSQDGLLTVAGAQMGQYVTVAASVQSNPEITGEFTLITAGSVSIPTSVIITGANAFATVTAGAYTTSQYTAVVEDQFGADITSSCNLVWSVDETSETSGISVDNTGLVTVSAGAAAGRLMLVVTAMANGVEKASALFPVQVTQSVEDIAFSTPETTMSVGVQRSMAVNILPANAANKAFTVQSDNTGVVTAVAQGEAVVLQSLAIGDATVTVTAAEGGYTDVLEVHVVSGQAGGLDMDFENGGAGWTYTSYNVIPNGDFETDQFWTSVGSSSGRADSGYTTDQVYQGNRSAHVTYGAGITGNQWSAFRNSAVYRINPLSTYRVAMAVNIPAIADGQRANLNFKITNDQLTTLVAEDPDIIRATAQTNGWEVKSSNFQVPENGTQITLFGARTLGSSGFTAYFDNLEFSTIAGVTDVQARTGSHAMQVGAYNDVHGTEAQQVLSADIPVTGGKTYTLDGSVKTDATATGGVSLIFKDNQGKILSIDSSAMETHTDWSAISHTAAAPTEAAAVQLALCAGGTGMAYFDSLGFTQEQSFASAVVIEGADILAIPAAASVAKSYRAYIADQFGVEMPGEAVTLTLSGNGAGVTLSGNSLTVTAVAQPGNVTLTATGGGLTVTKEISLRKVTGIMLDGLPGSIARPTRDVTYKLTLRADMGNGAETLDADQTIFALAESYNGVTLTGNTLTIGMGAALGVITVAGTWSVDETVSARADISIKSATPTRPGSAGGGGGGGGGSASGGGVAYIPGSMETPGEIKQPEVTKPDVIEPVEITDVDVSYWAYPAISEFAAKGLITGREEGKFMPEDSITRAELVTLLIRLMGFTTTNALSDVPDVPEAAWYARYVTAAYAHGITTGYEDGTFRPNNLITKEEIAVFITRAATLKHLALSTDRAAIDVFADGSGVSSYALESTEALRLAGVLRGDEAGMLHPQKTASRAEAVWMLYQVISNR